MKIQGPDQPGAPQRARGDGRPLAKAPAGAGELASPEDAVAVSPGAQALAAARAPETPDAARIAALQRAIAEGTFEVDPQRIAEAMLREER